MTMLIIICKTPVCLTTLLLLSHCHLSLNYFKRVCFSVCLSYIVTKTGGGGIVFFVCLSGCLSVCFSLTRILRDAISLCLVEGPQ